MKDLSKITRVLVSCLSLMVFLGLFSCSSNAPKGSSEAENLYNEAKKYMDGERYLLATEKLNTLKTQYPYSVFAKKGELLLAEIQFKQENYPEAAASFIAFRDLHPTYSEMPYVIWMTAESFYKQLPSTFDRDLSPGVDAKKYYNELLTTYATYEKNQEAKDRIVEIDKMLLNQELYIADFYFRTDEYSGAVYRYKNIIDHFTNNGKVLSVAPVRIVKGLIKLKKFSDCVSEVSKLMELDLKDSVRTDLKKLEGECKRKV